MTETFKIEKGIPFPQRRMTYSFAAMDVGDSFFAADMERDSAIRSSASAFGKESGGKKFSVAKVDGGVRVWRVK